MSELRVNRIQSQSGLPIETPTGIGFTPAGVGAVATTVQSKLREFVSAKDFGAVGDGVADDTVAIQAAINALSSGGTLMGGNLEYVVSSLYLKSNMTMQDFRLKTKAGAVDFVAPITIDGDTSPKTNIVLKNIHINGNRQNQTQILSPREDGGRHGFRVNGRVSNLTLSHCSASYCGTDGLHIFSSSSLPATDAYDGLCFQNVRIDNCVFDWNRRHGFAVDSTNLMRVISCDARHNGKDLDTTSPLSSGMRGARFNGLTYGRPFDYEGYGVGSAIHDIEIVGGDFTKNVGGALFMDSANPTATGFLPRKAIRISNARFGVEDSGLQGAFVTFGPLGTASLQVYEDLNISNCRFDNWIQIHSVNGLNVSGGSVVADYAGNTFYAGVGLSRNWIFNIRSNKPNVTFDRLPFEVTRTNVIGTPSFTDENYQLLGFTPNGYVIRYSAAVTGAAGSYYVTFQVSAGFLARCVDFSLIDPNTTVAETSASGIDGNSVLDASFNLAGTTVRRFQLTFEVIPNS